MLNIRLRQNTIMWALLLSSVFGLALAATSFEPASALVLSEWLFYGWVLLTLYAGMRLWVDRSDIRSELRLEGQNNRLASEIETANEAADRAEAARIFQRKLEAAQRREANKRQALRDQGKYGRRAFGSAYLVPKIDEACEVARDPGMGAAIDFGQIETRGPYPLRDRAAADASFTDAMARTRAELVEQATRKSGLVVFSGQGALTRARAVLLRQARQTPRLASIPQTGRIVFSGGPSSDSPIGPPLQNFPMRTHGSDDIDELQFSGGQGFDAIAKATRSQFEIDPDIAAAAEAMGVDLAHRIHDDVIVDLTALEADAERQPTISEGLRELVTQIDASQHKRDLHPLDGQIFAADRARERMVQAQTLDGTPSQRLLWASSQAELDKAVAAAQAKSDGESTEYRKGSKSAEVDELATAEREYRAARYDMANFILGTEDTPTARNTEDTARHEASSPAGGSGGSLTDHECRPGQPAWDKLLAEAVHGPTSVIATPLSDQIDTALARATRPKVLATRTTLEVVSLDLPTDDKPGEDVSDV